MEELLEQLHILAEDLTPTQLAKLSNVASNIDPKNISVDKALELFKEIGIDITKLYELQKKTRVARFQNRAKKIPVNSLCDCGSGKKYKKCCKMEGDASVSQTVKDQPPL